MGWLKKRQEKIADIGPDETEGQAEIERPAVEPEIAQKVGELLAQVHEESNSGDIVREDGTKGFVSGEEVTALEAEKAFWNPDADKV
jgi:hypothetical protein